MRTRIYRWKYRVFFSCFLIGICGFRSYVQILIHLYDFFVCIVKDKCPMLSISMWLSSFLQTIYWKNPFFPLCVLGTPDEDQSTQKQNLLFISGLLTYTLTDTQTQGNFWRQWVCFFTWIIAMVTWGIHMSKLTKFYILIMCNFLYIDYPL